MLPLAGLAVAGSPAVAQPANVWDVPLTTQQWAKNNGTQPHSMELTPGGLRFSMLSNSTRSNSTLTWNYDAAGKKLDGYGYCLITYRAEGISRNLDPGRSIGLIYLRGPGKDGDYTTYPIFDSSKAFFDGREHTVLVRRPLPPSVNIVTAEVSTQNSSASFTLKRLAFLDKVPSQTGDLKIENGWNVPGFESGAFKSISLNGQFNDSISQAYTRQIEGDGSAYGGGRDVPAGEVTIDGVPFTTGPAEKNLIHAAEDKSWMDEKVTFLGAQVARKGFMPLPRNDKISFPVNAKGSELYLLLQAESPSTWNLGVSPLPFQFPDIESIAVRLNYADGETDLAFPWSPSDAGFTIKRTLGSYAVPLDGKRVLKSVELVNREWNRNVSIAAATLNTSARQMFASAWKKPSPTVVPPIVAPRARAAFAKREGKAVVIGNRFYEVTADFSNGFVLKNLRNLYNSKTTIKLDPASGIELNVNGTILTGNDFTASKIEVKGASVKAELKPKDAKLPLVVKLSLTAAANQELQTNCSFEYDGAGQTALKFPYLKGMSIGNTQDTWYFFPECGNALTNKKGFYRSDNNAGFAVQFIDAFNPGQGAGVGLMTRNLGDAHYAFASQKNDSGVTQFIEYANNHGSQDGLRARITGITADTANSTGSDSVKADPTRTVTTSLVFHGGDWRESARIYQAWLKTWWKPLAAKNNTKWQNSWLIGCLWASERVSLQDLKVPPVFDPVTKKFRVQEAIEADKKYLGAKPDGYHYFKLVHDDERNYNLWNETAEGTYPRIGGLAEGQRMVKDFHDQDMFVSLYYIPDRYGMFSDLHKKIPQEKIASRDAAGNYLIWDGYKVGNADTIAACSDNMTWLKYLADNTNKIVRDLKVDSLYLDVFPMHSTRCVDPTHGHQIPANPNHGSLELLEMLRKAYPPKTTIWTEYQPSDIPGQYIDGYLSYSATSTSLILSPRWDEPEEPQHLAKPEVDIARYTMPQQKQFCLPQSYTLGWNVMKQMLFNGKGLFGGGWAQWDSDVSKLLGNQINLLRKYTDCFTSDKPEHLVDTLRGDVYANKWPGKNRTLWTVMNASGITVRGDVIAVQHKPNDTYINGATGKKLTYKVKGNTAFISMKLDPQSVSCIVQTAAAK